MMSKIIQLLAFIVISVTFNTKAQQFDATLYFLDGSKRTGKADMVSNEETKLAFIENGSKKKEKIKMNLLDKVEYINPKNNQPLTVEYRELIYYFLSDKPKSNYGWIKKTSISGDISTYVGYSYDAGVRNAYYYSAKPSELYNFFFQYKNEKPHLIYFDNSMWTPNKKQIVKRQVKNFFTNICPQLVSDFNDGKIEIKNNEVKVLIDYYEKNCSTNN